MIYLNTNKNIANFKNNKESIQNLEKLIEDLKYSKNIEEFWDKWYSYVQNSKSAEVINELILKEKEYLLTPIISYNSENYAKFLRFFERLNIDIAPKFVNTIKTSSGIDIIKSKIDGAHNSLLDLKDNKHLLTYEQKKKTISDIKKLLDLDIINPDIALYPQKSLKIIPSLPYKVTCIDWSNPMTTNQFLSLYGQNFTKESIIKIITKTLMEK